MPAPSQHNHPSAVPRANGPSYQPQSEPLPELPTSGSPSDPSQATCVPPPINTTPVRFGRASLERGGGTLTHDTVDQQMRLELDRLIYLDCLPQDTFLDTFVLPPAGNIERWLFDRMVDATLKGFRPPKSLLDAPFHDWLITTLKKAETSISFWLDTEISKWTTIAAQEEEGATQAISRQMDCLSLVDDNSVSKPYPTPTIRDALDILQQRCQTNHWRSCRAMAMRCPAPATEHVSPRRFCDLVLTCTPQTPSHWNSIIAIAEHKSPQKLGAPPKLSIQLGEYVSSALTAQSPFRRGIHAVTVVEGGLRCWVWDRCGALASMEVGISNVFPLLRTLFAYATMDITRALWDPTLAEQPLCPDTISLNKRQHVWYSNILLSPSPHIPIYTAINGNWFHLKRRIICRPGIACRATACYLADRVLSGSEVTCLLTRNTIIKWSWRFHHLPAEGDMLRKAHAPTEISGLVRLIAHDTPVDVMSGIRQGHTPTMRAGLILQETQPRPGRPTVEFTTAQMPPGAPENRLLTRIALSPVGEPLTLVTNNDEVKSLLLSILSALIAHRELYFDRGILHRDISINNILQTADGIANSNGLLIDLDYALEVGIPGGSGTRAGRSGAPHRTGTLPFMAIPILHNPGLVHRYHYDLQSFFFVLVWCCVYLGSNQPANRNQKAGSMQLHPDPLLSWRKGHYVEIALQKSKSLQYESEWQKLVTQLQPVFLRSSAVTSLLHQWRQVLFFREAMIQTRNQVTGKKDWTVVPMFVVDGRNRTPDLEDGEGLQVEEERECVGELVRTLREAIVRLEQ